MSFRVRTHKNLLGCLGGGREVGREGGRGCKSTRECKGTGGRLVTDTTQGNIERGREGGIEGIPGQIL